MPTIEIERVDVVGADASERDRHVQDTLARNAQHRFDLQAGSTIAAWLLRLDDTQAVLHVVAHPLVADGWSMGILLRELGARYRFRAAGHGSALAPLASTYSEQVARASSPPSADAAAGVARSAAYWRGQLERIKPIGLPYQSSVGLPSGAPDAIQQIEIGADVVAGLRALAARERCTTFVVLLAAFDSLLMRYSGDQVITVETPVVARTHVDREPLIGRFGGNVPIRVDGSGSPTFVELLARVRRATMDALTHGDVDVDRIKAEVTERLDSGIDPFHQVRFATQKLRDEGRGTGVEAHVNFGLIAAERVPYDAGAHGFDLSVVILEQGPTLQARLAYRPDRFAASLIAALARHFKALLASAASKPSQSIDDLQMMGQEEQAALIAVSRNVPLRARPAPEPTLVSRFAMQVAQRPNAVAVRHADGAMTYGQLDAQSNQLARRLARRDVIAGSVVGIALEQGPLMIVAMLAVIKSGAAYVYLDPDDPAKRLRQLTREAGAIAVLTNSAVETVWHPHDVLVANLERDSQRWATVSTDPLISRAPHKLLNVVYTPASTGSPKAVRITQDAVTRLVVDSDFVPIGPSDNVAQASNASSDAATFEIWGALLNGAQLTLIPEHVLLISEELDWMIRTERINTLFVGPAVFELHAERAPTTFAALDCLLFGGDRYNTEAVAKVVAAGAPRRLIYVWGPIEATTFTTAYEIPIGSTGTESSIPIGRPIAQAACFVLDAKLRDVPNQVAGELYIGGPRLAMGYAGNPELTARRFIEDPSGIRGRLFGTGERARRRPDGTLEWV